MIPMETELNNWSTTKRNTIHTVRLLSNLKMVLKIIEKVVAVRLNRYLEENNLNEPLQSAYKPVSYTHLTLPTKRIV